MYYNLNVHTAYDLLNSSIGLESLYKKLKEDGQEVVLVSDPNMYSAIKNYRLSEKYKIKLIHSLTVKVDYELKFLDISIVARNKRMFYKLLDISSDVQTSVTTMYLEDLLKNLSDYKDDCILLFNNSFTSPNSMTSLSELLKDYNHYFVYTEKDDYNIYANISNIVYASPAYYLDDKDYRTTLVARAIRDNKKINIEDIHVELGQNYVKKQEDFHVLINNLQNPLEKDILLKALVNQEKIISACSYKLDFSDYKLPKYVYSEEEAVFEQYSAYDYLKYLTVQSLKEKGKAGEEVYKKRLQYELTVIKDMGFEDYFLIVQDFVKYAKSQKILVGDGRGSAAGSLVCYLLGITQADPLQYDLLFERFLNKDRISMPDIDIDFQDTRRDEVIKYVEDKYGAERVAQIITFGTFQAKAAARETARIFNFPEAKLKFISKNVSSRKTLKESYEDSKELKEFVDSTKQHKIWFSIAQSLEGLPKNKSVHAAGLVISGQGLIRDYTALEKSNLTQYLSQWTMDDLEYIGLLKIDFLGIRYLTMLQNIADAVREEDKDFSLDTITYDDPNVYNLFSTGDTEGIFQFENTGLRSWLRVLKPTEFKDIYAMTSLYRPGPMEHIGEYIDRKFNKEKITYLHPSLEEILKETYGIIVYQEQIMQIAVKYAGMSLNEADNMRRAVSKKDQAKLVEYGNIFVKKSIECGQRESIAKKLYDQIVTFARYGFNKSHAVVYSMLAYKLAYMKTYHKKHFMTELLNNVISDSNKINDYKNELNKNKIKLLSPDVNISRSEFSVYKNNISFALLAIKNVGYKSAENIVFERERYGKYLDIDDFLKRVDKKVDQQAAISLVKAGALDCFGYNRATLLNKVKTYFEDTRENINDIRLVIDSLSGLTLKVEELEELSLIERINMEKEVTGTYFLKHPVVAEKEAHSYLPLKYISNKSLDSYVEIVSVKEIKDKKGGEMAFVTVNDGRNNYEVVVFSSEYQYMKSKLKNNSFLVLSLKHQIKDDKDSYILEKAVEFEVYKNFCLSNVKQISVLVSDKNKEFLKSVLLPSGKGNLYLFDKNNPKDKKVYSVKNEQEFVRKYLESFDKNTIKIGYVTV